MTSEKSSINLSCKILIFFLNGARAHGSSPSHYHFAIKISLRCYGSTRVRNVGVPRLSRRYGSLLAQWYHKCYRKPAVTFGGQVAVHLFHEHFGDIQPQSVAVLAAVCPIFATIEFVSDKFYLI